MKLFILRHAIAAARDPIKYPTDSRRPLTSSGRKKMERAARGLRSAGFRFDLILTSPFLRAKQTAEILAEAFDPRVPIQSEGALTPAKSTKALLRILQKKKLTDSVVLVGHEPDLSRIAGDFLTGSGRGFPLELKKGGLCRIDFEGAPNLGTGRLILHVPSKLLRRFSR